MADGSNLLERLSNAIATAVNPTAKNMTRDEFITYASEQIIAIGKDKDPEVAKARLAALDKARIEAKKFDEHTSVRISIFDPAQLTAEQTTTERDPVKSNDRQDEAPETGQGEQGQTAKSKSQVTKYSQAIADLDSILNPSTEKTEDEQGKAGAPFGGGGGGGGGGATEDEEDDEEDEEEVEAGKGEGDSWIDVDENDPAQLFPLDMNEQRFDAKKGRLVRKSRTWGDDPAEVRGQR